MGRQTHTKQRRHQHRSMEETPPPSPRTRPLSVPSPRPSVHWPCNAGRPHHQRGQRRRRTRLQQLPSDLRTLQRTQSQRGGSSSTALTSEPGPLPARETPRIALMHRHFQRFFSGRSVQPHLGRDLVTQDCLAGGRSSAGPERSGRNAKPTAQVASRRDSGERHRHRRRTGSRRHRPRTYSDRLGRHVDRADHHLHDTRSTARGCQAGHDSTATQRFLIATRTAPKTRGQGPGGGVVFCRIGTVARGLRTHFRRVRGVS